MEILFNKISLIEYNEFISNHWHSVMPINDNELNYIKSLTNDISFVTFKAYDIEKIGIKLNDYIYVIHLME